MEHIVQFAIGIDDEAIRKRIEETAEKRIIDSIRKEVAGKIFRKGNWKDDSELQSWVKDMVVEVILEHRDEIIKEAASALCEYMKRTKAVRKAVEEVLEETGE